MTEVELMMVTLTGTSEADSGVRHGGVFNGVMVIKPPHSETGMNEYVVFTTCLC